MTPLNNNRGVALVVLIIAMTLIAVLSTSLVSIVADKNKSMIYAYDGYHASVIADSGVEFAIRYISDGLSNSESEYFKGLEADPTGSIGYMGYSPVYKIAGVTKPIGEFRTTRTLKTSNIENDTILVESSYNGGISVRKVAVKRFRRFLSPITLYPDYATRPVRRTSPYRIDVRILGNHSNNLSVSKIELMSPGSTPGNVYLRQVWALPYSSSIPVFDYTSAAVQTAYASRPCTSNPAPCLDSIRGLRLEKGDFTELMGLTTHTVYPDNNASYYQFVFESAPHLGQYNARLTAGSWTPVLTFTPHEGS